MAGSSLRPHRRPAPARARTPGPWQSLILLSGAAEKNECREPQAGIAASARLFVQHASQVRQLSQLGVGHGEGRAVGGLLLAGISGRTCYKAPGRRALAVLVTRHWDYLRHLHQDDVTLAA